MNENYAKLEAEDAALLELMKNLDPGSKEYETAFKAHITINKEKADWVRLNLEQRKIDSEQARMDHEKLMEETRQKENRRNNWFQVGIAGLTTFGAVFGRVWASHILRKATRETYGLDQEKIPSKAAADVVGKGIKFIS